MGTSCFMSVKDFILRTAPALAQWRPMYALLTRLGMLKRRSVVKMDGGLASQMWQFSLGYALERRTGYPSYFETDFFRKSGRDLSGNRNRIFLLTDTFPAIRERYASRFDVSSRCLFCRLLRDLKPKGPCDFDEDLFRPGPKYLSQYYVNPHYFAEYRDELVELFRFRPSMSEREESVAARIASDEHACLVHVRRGDFVGSAHDVCTPEYYLGALEIMRQRDPLSRFYVFSNAVEYCRDLFAHSGADLVYMENQQEIDPRVDFYMMTLFSRAIISNSNFSWFPAFLASGREDSCTICPEYWFRGSAAEGSRHVCAMPGWISL